MLAGWLAGWLAGCYPKNIPPANADQLQPKLPHQSCVLRIPKKTPLNRRSSRHAPVILLPQKTSRLQTPTNSSPICRIRVARCGSQTRHRRHAPVIMLPQKTSSMQTPTNSGPSCRIRLARCGSHTGHLNPKASQTRTCQTVTPKNIPPANADQLQLKLPHPSRVLRIPKKTPLNRGAGIWHCRLSFLQHVFWKYYSS